MPLDHYQPAAFIGGFSQDVQPRSRDRAVWVARRGVRGPYRRRAAKVAAKRNLYPARIDAIWRQSEALLPEAIAVLADGPGGIDERALYLWHRSLVPFLAGLFVRGPEFHERYHARFGDELRTVMSEHFGGPNASTDIARIVERQRLLAPLMYADWHVLRFDNGPALITSDVGYTITARSGDWGYTVPLNKEIAVAVYPCRRRELKGLAFFASNESEALNEAVAANAVSESYCSHAELAATALRAMEAIPASKHAVGPGLFGFEPEELRRMEMDWIEIGDSIHPWSEEPRCEDIAVAVRVTRVGYVIADLPWALRVSRETRV